MLFLASIGLALLVDRRQLPAGEHYGVSTGWSGIRGTPSGPTPGFTQAQIDAYNRQGALQGLRGGSVAPPA